MKKNLPTLKQNSRVALHQSKSLMTITNNILSKDDWMQRLWDWADENNIQDLEWIGEEDYEHPIGLPRDKKELLNFFHLEISGNELITIAKEIGNLNSLTTLWLNENKLSVLPKEICKLKNLTHLWLKDNKLSELPKEIGNLTTLTDLSLSRNQLLNLPLEIGNLLNLKTLYLYNNQLEELPKEICKLKNLTNLWLKDNNLSELPKEIVKLTNLSILNIEDNANLILAEEQKEWIYDLIQNGCDVMLNGSYGGSSADAELLGRYKFLYEFNIGREVTITPELLDDDIPPRITAKLADGTLTFEEYLDEVSDYLDKEKFSKKEKFNNLIQKIYDRDYELGSCFERNISFESFIGNKLTWTSIAEGIDKEILITHWGIINMFVKDIFGFETKIVNSSKQR